LLWSHFFFAQNKALFYGTAHVERGATSWDVALDARAVLLLAYSAL
jgi:hypothetical protein